ncbi:MAG: endo-1,4-beta-xylanase [Clostridia bacterium]|nr:endo-1,4-beta-xylanase [Clostridia bacterium]
MSRRETALKYFERNRDYTDYRVKTGIELYRKGNATLKVTDEKGNPAKGAKVFAKQKNHEFKYGANIFMLDEFENSEKNAIYRESFRELFNLATVPFYWSDLEPEQGKPRYAADSPRIYRRPATDLCVDYCLENGIEPKCHCLNYDNFLPEWLHDASVEYHKEMLEKRFFELSERYSKKIPSWEVTNETFCYYMLAKERGRDYSKFYMCDDFVEWSFLTADKYFHNNRLIINDYNVWGSAYSGNRSAYYMQIERLLQNKSIHLDSVGMQQHVFAERDAEKDAAFERYNPEFVYRVLDTYAALGKKIQITEMTLSAYSNEPEDEDIQAEIVKNLYPIYFSHPAMEAVIYWNLVDGYAAFAPQGDMTAGENRFHGGLMRYDMSKKPAYYALKELFSKTWITNAETVADDGGVAHLRGFYGDYELKVAYDGKEYDLDMNILSSRENINRIVLK